MFLLRASLSETSGLLTHALVGNLGALTVCSTSSVGTCSSSDVI